MLDGLFQLISGLLNVFYELVPNYAVAIALLTLVIMLITTPLTLKSTRSMIEMQRLQPEIRRLQVQYKDDRQKLNEELMKFYKEHEINPLGGCLPMLVQLPVFSILFYVVRGLTNEANFVGVQKVLATLNLDTPITITPGFRPKYLNHSTELYQSLLGKTEMDSFGVDLAQSASQALRDGFVTALPYLLLVAVIGGLSWYQQKQIMGRNPNSEMTSQQRTLMRIGPVMFVFFAFVSPAAIGVYFVVSSLWRVGQQHYITRSLYRGEDSIGLQAQQAMAELRQQRGKDGARGGFLGALTGDAGRSPEKSAAKPTSNGRDSKSASRAKGTPRAGKSAARPASSSASPGGRPASKPHPRSRKKKKRK